VLDFYEYKAAQVSEGFSGVRVKYWFARLGRIYPESAIVSTYIKSLTSLSDMEQHLLA